MQSGFVALNRGEATDRLQECHPKAFLLLALIARRARWSIEPDLITGLEKGQSFLGDYKTAGLKTEGEYRQAKKVLERTGVATFQGTNKGTVATLINSIIWSITIPLSNDHNNGHGNSPATTTQRANNDPATTNHKEHKGTNKHGHKDSACLDEVLCFAREIGMATHLAQEFFQTMKENDWETKQGPVRSWKATMIGFWERRKNLP